MRKTKTKDPLFLSLQGAVLVVALGVPLFLLGTSYDNFIDLVLEKLDRGPYRDAAEAYFPEFRFRLIRWISLSLGCMAIWVVFRYQNQLQQLYEGLRITIKQGCQSLMQMLQWKLPSGKFLVLLLSVSFLRMSYYIITMPLIYDECWTFLNFTRHGPLSAVLTYPSSNNHILVSLASSILYLLHLPPVVALRLPVLLFGLLSILIFYKFLTYFFGHGISCIVTTFYSCSIPLSLYMMLARGYAPICLCYLILLHEVFVQKRMGSLFIFASILGFYSVPTFIYPFSLVIGYLILEVIFRKRPIHSVLKPFIIIAISVAVLYAPFIATKTFALSIHKNTAIFATEINSQFVLAYLAGLFNYLLSSDYVIPLFCIGLLAMAYKGLKDKIRPTSLLLFSALTLFSPILFIITQELRIPLRIFTFLVVHVGVIAGYMMAIKGGKSFSSGGLVYSACFFIWILFVGLFQSHPEVRKLASQNGLLHQVSSHVLEQDRRAFFLDYEVIKPILSYRAALKNQKINIKMAQENSLDYKDFSPSDYYDVLIVGNTNATIAIDEIPLDIYDKVSYEDFTLFQRRNL